MTLYSVFDRRQNEAPEVVPDRFSWFAALLPPAFGLANRLWLLTLLWAVLVVAIVFLGRFFGTEVGVWTYVFLSLLIGFEAPGLRHRALRRRGYIYRSELIAADADLAQVDWMQRRSRA